MERREFLKHTAASSLLGGAVVAGVVASGCTSESSGAKAPGVQTQPRVRWRLASSFPRSLDTIFGAADVLAERVKALTDGRFTIEVFQAGELVPALHVLDEVRQNNIAIAHTASYYFLGKNEALAFDTSVPFGLTTRQQSAWSSEGGGRELLAEVYSDFNIVPLAGGNTGVQMGGWFRRPIGSTQDLKGLKMRIPGLGGKVMDRLGVNVQNIPGGEIYPSLERGVIDATEWVGPYDDQKLGFHQIAKIYHYPGWWEPGPALSFLVNKDEYAKLPSAYKAALEVAANESAHRMQMEYDAKNPVALQSLLASDVKLTPFPKDVLTAARKAMDEYHAEQIAQNSSYKKIYEHWSKFKNASDDWVGTAEYSYLNFLYG